MEGHWDYSVWSGVLCPNKSCWSCRLKNTYSDRVSIPSESRVLWFYLYISIFGRVWDNIYSKYCLHEMQTFREPWKTCFRMTLFKNFREVSLPAACNHSSNLKEWNLQNCRSEISIISQIFTLWNLWKITCCTELSMYYCLNNSI